MEDPAIQFSQEIFEKYSLSSIHGKQFTPREIDVIACIISGRSPKSIASFLSINIRTVETHMYNIRQKLDCHSRESIRSFIEKSNKFIALKKYYTSLLIQESYQKKLRATSSIEEQTRIMAQLKQELEKHKEEMESRNEIFYSSPKIFRKFHIIVTVCFIIFLLSLALISTKTLWYSSLFSNTVELRSDLITPTTFLERPELLTQIKKKLNNQKGIKTVALLGIVGMGGAGKTTLARAFGKTQKASIVWEVNAEFKDSLENSFKDLAYALAKTKEQKEEINFIQQIQNPEERIKQILVFVKRGLKEKGNWLLIYDNVETLSDILNYFPQDPEVWGHGKVIITTRDATIKNTGHIQAENIVQIEELSEQESLTLFSKILYERDSKKLNITEREEAINFLKNIPPFPLDISVAAYYIKNSQISCQQYLEKINQNSNFFESKQSVILKEITQYTKTRYGIITSSLQKEINLNPVFKELWFLISLLDSQNIPKELIKLYMKNTQDLEESEFFHRLKKYSLITSETSEAFSLHRSTQILGQAYLLSILTQEEKIKILEKSINTLKSLCNLYHEKNINSNLVIIAHLEALLQNVNNFYLTKKLREKYEFECSLLLGYIHYRDSNQYVIAKKYLDRAYVLQTNYHFIPDAMFVELLSDLAEIYAIASEYDKGLLLCQKCLKLCSQLSDPKLIIPKTLTTMGFMYRRQNNFSGSKACLEQALDKISTVDNSNPYKIELEAEIYRTMAALYNVTYLYKKEGLEAEKYALKALEILKAPGSLNSPKKGVSLVTAWVKMTLSTIYCTLNDYKKALIQINEAELILQNLNGTFPVHLVGLPFGKTRLLLSKGEVLLRLGDLVQAENVLSEAIRLSASLIGDVDTVIMRIYRAETRVRLGKLDEAFEDLMTIFKIGKKVSNNYFDLMYTTCFYHAAIVKYRQGDIKSSLLYFADFFKNMKPFCQSFLDKEVYEQLETQGMFNHSLEENENIKTALQKAAVLFSKICKPTDSLLRDYVLKNR